MKKVLVMVVFLILIVLLGYLIVVNISKPVRFHTEVKKREIPVVDRLKDIRTLQEAYKTKYGRFTSSLDTLIDFYKSDSLVIVRQVGSMDDSLAVAQKRVRRDSIKISVRDTLLRRPNFVPDSIRWVPYSGGKEFLMEAVIKTVSGVPVPLFEAFTPWEYVLTGMDRQLIVNLKADNKAMNRYPGLKVGSIENPNNNAGNWE